ncbi:hypothetical protein S40288_04993 [Stachybotrys chartarum IBT 40288]|nr:hypothetical protein S40288_04993 [Stachybotrys chartarum IBT 40288]
MKTLSHLYLPFLASFATAEVFDYVIVGAGTSGLVLANRLTEDSSVKVVVIEAGHDERDNPLVRIPNNFVNSFSTPLNWNYTTVPQPAANNRSLGLVSGRAWGGTSAINGMTYIRATRKDIDIWEQLGNDGWNYDALAPYFKKSEDYIRPNPSQVATGATYDLQYHGLNGNVRVAYRQALVNSSTFPLVRDTLENFDVGLSPDINSGDVRGFAIAPSTIDPAPAGDNRWDAATAYLYPVEDRPNLSVLQGTVTRILWAGDNKTTSTCGRLTANGVEYVTSEDLIGSVQAKEVILSAGALRSPSIIEASGIGNPSVLESLGVDTKISLPGVGALLHDQTSHYFIVNGTLDTVEGAFTTYVTAAQVFGDTLDEVAASSRSRIPAWAQSIVERTGGGFLNATAVETLLGLQHDLLFLYDNLIGEIIISSLGGYIASSYWALFPFTRGSVHLSPDDVNRPTIDLNILQVDFDVEVTTAIGRFVQNFWRTAPVSAHIVGQIDPPEDLIPVNATFEQWAAWIRSAGIPDAHPYASAAMLPRELGGVVDPELKVYGTNNVRIVDASIFPFQNSGHPTATLYAVAERAADIFKTVRRPS